jgi:hypothetical protein
MGILACIRVSEVESHCLKNCGVIIAKQLAHIDCCLDCIYWRSFNHVCLINSSALEWQCEVHFPFKGGQLGMTQSETLFRFITFEPQLIGC